jgi:hypothetical protein
VQRPEITLSVTVSVCWDCEHHPQSNGQAWQSSPEDVFCGFFSLCVGRTVRHRRQG